jgi:hypothetical protein
MPAKAWLGIGVGFDPPEEAIPWRSPTLSGSTARISPRALQLKSAASTDFATSAWCHLRGANGSGARPQNVRSRTSNQKAPRQSIRREMSGDSGTFPRVASRWNASVGIAPRGHAHPCRRGGRNATLRVG